MRKPFLAHSVNISASISKPLASSSKRRIASLRYAQNHVHTSLMRAPNSAHSEEREGVFPTTTDLLSVAQFSSVKLLNLPKAT